MSKFIQFRRNQANTADKLQLPTEGIISIGAADITSCLILYTPILKVDADTASAPQCLQYDLTVAATGGATLTRANIVQKVQDAINKAEINGGDAYSTLADMEVQLVGVAAATVTAAP